MRCYCTYIVSGSSQAIPAEFSSFCMETINSNSPNRMCCNVMVVHWAAFVWLGFGLWRVWMKCVRLILFRFAEVASNRKYINYLHKCKKKEKKENGNLFNEEANRWIIYHYTYVCMYVHISISILQIFLLIFFSFTFNRFFSNLKWWGVN